MLHRVACVLILASTYLASMAWAAPAAEPADPKTQEALDIANTARAKFAAKSFREAAQLFMDAYAKVPEPSLLFNAARCYEELGERKEALPLFQLYLSVEPESEVAGRRDAQSRILRIEAELKAQVAQAKSVDPVRPPPEPLPPPKPKSKPVVVAPSPPPPQVWRARTPWLLAGTGLALTVVGAIVRGTASSGLDDLDARAAATAQVVGGVTVHPGVTQRELDAAIASRDTRRTTGGWLIGTGVVAVAAGATLWWWADRPGWVQVQPLLGADLAGVALAGAL